MGDGWQYEGEALERLRSATPKDLQDAAEHYLDPTGLTLAALLPESTDAALDGDALRAAVEQGLATARSKRPEAAREEKAAASPPVSVLPSAATASRQQ